MVWDVNPAEPHNYVVAVTQRIMCTRLVNVQDHRSWHKLQAAAAQGAVHADLHRSQKASGAHLSSVADVLQQIGQPYNSCTTAIALLYSGHLQVYCY